MQRQDEPDGVAYDDEEGDGEEDVGLARLLGLQLLGAAVGRLEGTVRQTPPAPEARRKSNQLVEVRIEIPGWHFGNWKLLRPSPLHGKAQAGPDKPQAGSPSGFIG